jgi:hypothetical protein
VDPGFAGLAAGPFVAACTLLVIAGCGKITRPGPAREALVAAGLGAPRGGVVGLGVVEIAAGIAGAVIGGVAAIAVAVWYLALTAFAWRLLRRAPTTPCGCLGSPTATVSRGHLIFNVAAAGIALVSAAGGSPLARLAGHPLATVLFAVLVACCVKLAALVLDALPAVERAVKDGIT